jgi:hypothetical protein
MMMGEKRLQMLDVQRNLLGKRYFEVKSRIEKHNRRLGGNMTIW